MRYTPDYSSFFDDGPGNNKGFLEVPNVGPGIQGLYYRLDFIHVIFTTSLIAGGRCITLQVRDENDNLMYSCFSTFSQNRLQNGYYLILPNGYPSNFNLPLVGGATRLVNMGFPERLHLSAGWKARVLDIANRDSAGDTMVISGAYEKLQF